MGKPGTGVTRYLHRPPEHLKQKRMMGKRSSHCSSQKPQFTYECKMILLLYIFNVLLWSPIKTLPYVFAFKDVKTLHINLSEALSCRRTVTPEEAAWPQCRQWDITVESESGALFSKSGFAVSSSDQRVIAVNSPIVRNPSGRKQRATGRREHHAATRSLLFWVNNFCFSKVGDLPFFFLLLSLWCHRYHSPHPHVSPQLNGSHVLRQMCRLEAKGRSESELSLNRCRHGCI